MAGLFNKFKKKNEDNRSDVKSEAGVKIEKKAGKPEVKKVVSKKPTKKVEEKVKSVKKKLVKPGREAYKVLVKPIISEKATVAESLGVYTFKVSCDASKIEIAKAVMQIYGVTPKKIRVINMEGKKMRYGRKFGRRSDWKKALISLPKGQSISIHEGV